MRQTDSADSVLRAMTNDGAFRVITARTTDTVARTLDAQGASGDTARNLGELVTGSILVRETMAPDHRVQGLYKTADRRGQLVADTHPDGGTRGLASHANGSGEVPLEGGTLEMMRTLRSGELHRGLVDVPSGKNLSDALMSYMTNSEQVASMLSVGCVIRDGDVSVAGGYIVQLLPEVNRAVLSVMTERLAGFDAIEELLLRQDGEPERMLNELLHGMEFTRLDSSPLMFRCRCSSIRVIASLATLGREELVQMIEEPSPISVSCDYCGQDYEVSPHQLKGLLEAS